MPPQVLSIAGPGWHQTLVCDEAGRTPSSGSAYSTGAATPPTVAVKAPNNGIADIAMEPSCTPETKAPPPVPYSVIAEPFCAGFFVEFAEKSRFNAAACPMPPASVNNAGDAACDCNTIAFEETSW